jgi:uncharacterized protein
MMFIQDTQSERPLIHDLLENILRDTYFARLVLRAENELHEKKIIEIDAQSSDGIVMATQQAAPIYVSFDVWSRVEDLTEALRQLEEKADSHTEDSEEEEEA